MLFIVKKETILRVFAVFSLTICRIAFAGDNDECESSHLPEGVSSVVWGAVVGSSETPVASLLEKHFGGNIQEWLLALEADVIEVINAEPELHESLYRKFTEKYKLDTSAFETIVEYYAQVFGNQDLISPVDDAEILKRNKAIERGPPELRHRYLFYLFHITKLSVPEMSDVLGLDEPNIYKEIRSL